MTVCHGDRRYWVMNLLVFKILMLCFLLSIFRVMLADNNCDGKCLMVCWYLWGVTNGGMFDYVLDVI
jgi:hypothetical protein